MKVELTERTRASLEEALAVAERLNREWTVPIEPKYLREYIEFVRGLLREEKPFKFWTGADRVDCLQWEVSAKCGVRLTDYQIARGTVAEHTVIKVLTIWHGEWSESVLIGKGDAALLVKRGEQGFKEWWDLAWWLFADRLVRIPDVVLRAVQERLG